MQVSVVIAGCGDLGTETGLRFAALGHRVVGLRRSADKLPPEIEGQSVDLSAETPILPADTGIVVIAMAPDERTADAYRAAYVDSVRHVVAAIHRDCATTPRVLFVSSTAVYGVDDGSFVNASTPAAPATPTATILLEAEESLLAQIPAAIILRLGGIYGPGRNREIDRLRSGSASIPHEARFTNRIHRDDAAAAIVHLTTLEDQPSTVHVGVDNAPVDHRDVVEFLADRMGLPVPPVDTHPERFSRGRGKRCDNSQLRQSGFVFTYPTYREGYAAVLDGNGVRHP